MPLHYIVKSVHRAGDLWLGNDSVCNERVNHMPPIDSPERARQFPSFTLAQVAGDNWRRSFRDGPNTTGAEYHGLFGKLEVVPVNS
jgi:hypothetical protein